MRQKVVRLSQYQILSPFKFVDLMFLAQNFQQKTFLYKQYLFQEGQIPSDLYLIEEGQFHYTKKLQDNQEENTRNKLKQKSLRDKRMTKQGKLKLDIIERSIYNATKIPKLKQFQIASFSGGIGQTLGQEELILNRQKRIYNAKCASTKNKVIVIKRDHFNQLLIDNPQVHKLLKQQILKKAQAKKKIYTKIQQTRSNLQSFVRLTRQQKKQLAISPSHVETQISSSTQFYLPIINRRNQSSIIKSTQKNKNKSYQQKHKPQQEKFKHIVIEEEANVGETFMLTEFTNQTIKHVNEHKPIQIREETQEQEHVRQFDVSIPLKVSKSWNPRDSTNRSINLKRKYLGLVDSSALIKQKQHILSIRKIDPKNDTRIDFQLKQRDNYKKMLIQKQRGKQSNPAHSRHYMQKMLLNALKKAGYHQNTPSLMDSSIKKTQNIQVEDNIQITSQVPPHSESFSFKKQKIVDKLKKKQRHHHSEIISDVLEKNPFDQCYFGKI